MDHPLHKQLAEDISQAQTAAFCERWAPMATVRDGDEDEHREQVT